MQVGMKLKDFTGYLSDIRNNSKVTFRRGEGPNLRHPFTLLRVPGETLPPHSFGVPCGEFSSADGDGIGL